jgi:hypothetical protein
MQEVNGAYAEYVIVDSADLAVKPRTISHDEAAAVPQVCHAVELNCSNWQTPHTCWLVLGAGMLGGICGAWPRRKTGAEEEAERQIGADFGGQRRGGHVCGAAGEASLRLLCDGQLQRRQRRSRQGPGRR